MDFKIDLIGNAQAKVQSVYDQFDFNTAETLKLEQPEEKQEYRIKKMTKCLHGRPCDFLCSNPPERPFCKFSGVPIFDLGQCPKRRWF